MRSITYNNTYRLPWETYDNPNGWIEPTTYCQLKCPGCYRGLDKPDYKPQHHPLIEMKKQIDWMVKCRNIQTLSVAGGDPMLYPQLYELIRYASSLKLRTMMYTNGIGLNKNELVKLKECGITQVVIHIDKFQDRINNPTNQKIIELQEEFCNIFREVKGVNLGFIRPITPSCLDTLNEFNNFFNSNRDIISLVVYTLYREISWTHNVKPNLDTGLSMQDTIDNLQKNRFIKPAAYLPGTINHNEPAWLFSFSIGTKNKNLGFVNARLFGFIHRRYYNKHKRYLFITQNNKVKRRGLLKLFFFIGIIKILIRSLVNFKPLFFQTYLIIRGPVAKKDKWDLCQGCPDAMLYNGKLEPSCILEEIQLRIKNNQE